MGLCGKFCMVAIAALVATVAVLKGSEESEECAVLRNTLLTQASMDAHRDGTFDFSYVPLWAVIQCGAASLRMPHPYKVQLTRAKSDEELQKLFFTLKKPTVRIRKVRTTAPNQTLEKLMVSSIGAFTYEKDEELPFPEAHKCLSGGTCALFFDNSWHFDDVKPMLEGTGVEPVFAHTRFGNMFCTNISDSRVTARLHSAPHYGSIAVQMAGVKRWQFWNPATLNKYGIVADEWKIGSTLQSRLQPFAGQSQVMNKLPHYTVTTGPGELLYFPSHWTHVVWTEPGWNTMINLRMCFTVRTLAASFWNAWNIHSFSGALKLLAFNMVQYGLPDEQFRTQIAKSHDRAKMGNTKIAEHMDTFINLNMDNM